MKVQGHEIGQGVSTKVLQTIVYQLQKVAIDVTMKKLR